MPQGGYGSRRAAFGFPLSHRPLNGFPQLQPAMQAEAEGIVALYNDFRDQRAAQLCVWAVEEVRPILQQCYQLSRLLGGGIPLDIH